MRVLITGINGFAAGHLVDVLLRHSCEVIGTARAEAAGGKSGVRTIRCDIRDADTVRAVVSDARPQMIFHLAAISSELDVRHDPTLAYRTNVDGTIHLLEAVRAAKIEPVILLAGSSSEYGFTEPGENPIAETQPLRPVNAYAVSKVAQSLIGYQYFKCFGQRIVRTRAFNHFGPNQRDIFVTASFARDIAEIERGRQPAVIHVGHLESRRDFTDVRDVVRAYWLAAKHGIVGEIYNVCSGKEVSAGELLRRLISLSGVAAETEMEAQRVRPFDVPVQTGTFAKLQGLTGWEPTVPLDQSLRDVLEDWRKRLGAR